MTKQPIDVTIVVPVYNNAPTLRVLYQQIKQVMIKAELVFEVIFVNDAGPDNSLMILLNLFESEKHVSLVNMKNNVGQHLAVLHGLNFAQGQCCIIMDADLQDPPEALLSLCAMRQPSYKAIFAGRRGDYQCSSRMFFSRIYKTLLHYLIGLPKDAGIFVLLEREMVNAILRMPVRRPFINVMIGLSGLPFGVIPVKRQLREKGVSAYSAWGRLCAAAQGITCIFSYYLWKPEKAFLDTSESMLVDFVKLSGGKIN